MTDPFQAYMHFTALKRHFTQRSYNYFKYNGKLNLKRERFEEKKDKYYFEKLAKNKDYHEFALANLAKNPKLWIGKLVSSAECKEIYTQKKRRMESISYTFREEIEKLPGENIIEIVKCTTNQPILLNAYLTGDISLEVFCIFIDCIGAKPYFDNFLSTNPEWNKLSFLFEKYIPFLKYDKETIKKIIREKFYNYTK